MFVSPTDRSFFTLAVPYFNSCVSRLLLFVSYYLPCLLSTSRTLLVSPYEKSFYAVVLIIRGVGVRAKV